MPSAVRIPPPASRLGPSAGRRGAACAGVLASSLALAAVANAQVPISAVGNAKLATDRACYAEGDTIQFSGSGYTPNAPVTVSLASRHRSGHFNATADAAGALALTATAPTLDQLGADPPREELLTAATDQSTVGPDGPTADTLFGTARLTLSVRGLVVRPWAITRPAPGKPKRVVTLQTFGWTPQTGTLYVHYVRAGRLVRTVPLGHLRGSCGDLTRRMREFPFRPVPAGSYLVQFDNRLAFTTAGPRMGYRRVVVAPTDALP